MSKHLSSEPPYGESYAYQHRSVVSNTTNRRGLCLKVTPDFLLRMFFIVHAFLFALTWCLPAWGKLQANCSSGMNVSNSLNVVTEISGRLPDDNNLQRSCVLKLDKPSSFLRVSTRRNDNKRGESRVSLIE